MTVQEDVSRAHPSMQDRGPAVGQVPEEDSSKHPELSSHGMVTKAHTNTPKKKDKEIATILEQALGEGNARNKGRKATIEFPHVSADVLSECNQDSRLFVKGFPWLFPGGIGDLSDAHNVKVKDTEWVEQLVHCRDGWFARAYHLYQTWFYYFYSGHLRACG